MVSACAISEYSSFSAKNVATDISEKLCNSVAAKLEGKVLGTFTGNAND